MPVSAYTPTPEDVAPLIRNRTRDSNGNTVGTFTDDGRTTPSHADVLQIIQDALMEVYPSFGDDIPDNPGDPSRAGFDIDILRKAAKRVVAIHAACLIELTYYADQVGSGKSPYEALNKRYEDFMKRLSKAIMEAGVGDVPGSSDDAIMPLGEFQGGTVLGLGTWL